MSVTRELDCDEEQQIMAIALKYLTLRDKPLISPDDVECVASMILSSLSWAGYKIVEGVCLSSQFAKDIPNATNQAAKRS